METNVCPNCDAPLKSGLFNYNKLIYKESSDVIDLANGTDIGGYCEKCSNNLLGPAIEKVKGAIEEMKQRKSELLKEIPIVTIHNPQGWMYQAIGFASEHSVTGTGVFSELSMTVNDVMGSESNSMNRKIRDAELICISRLRSQAVEKGGNALVGLDVNYAEIGSLRGMIMVCCTATVVEVTNKEVLSPEANSALDELRSLRSRFYRFAEVYQQFKNLTVS